jgi:hypothetical protein
MKMIDGFYVVRSESKIPRKAFDLLFEDKDLITLKRSKQDKKAGDWWHYIDVAPEAEGGPFLFSYAFALGQMIERYNIEAEKAKRKE